MEANAKVTWYSVLSFLSTCWGRCWRRAGGGQRSCNKEKWSIIGSCCIMHAAMLCDWLETVTAPNQYDYLLEDVVPIGYGSNRSAGLKNNFTLTSLSIVTMAHLVSKEFWSQWLIMERFNAVWMVNRNTTAGEPNSISVCIWLSLTNGKAIEGLNCNECDIGLPHYNSGILQQVLS